MSSQDDFDAALLAPDNDVGHRFLFQITSATRFSAPSLPTTAEKYFDVFCDDTSSRIRRRWAGVALQKMIIKSDKVAKHFRTLDLQRLGHVMLSGTELEETKVVAGLIVRGAIEQKIGFTKFWPNDRVHSKEPAFPSLAEPKWMDVFQTFLDTLTEMIPPNPNGEPTVLFPISLVASDNFKWRDSTDVPMISFTQGEHLTIIIPNSTMQTFGFVDIPLARICGTHRRRSVLHDSQGKRTDHEPWDIVLELTPEPWTYLIDTTEHVGTEFTILFATEKDAKMCEQSITELVGPLTKPKASGSQLLNVSKIVTSTTSSQALKLQDTSLKKTVDKELHESNASRRPTSSQALSFGRPSASQTKDVGGASSVGERANDAAAVGDTVSTESQSFSNPSPRRTSQPAQESTAINAPGIPLQQLRPELTLPHPAPAQASSTSDENENEAQSGLKDKPSVAVVEYPEPQCISIPGALPRIQKPVRATFEKTTDRDEFELQEEESPKEKRRIGKTTSKGAGLSRVPATRKKLTTAKLATGKSKPKPKPKPRQQVNDTEDDEDPISSQIPLLSNGAPSSNANQPGTSHGTLKPSKPTMAIEKANKQASREGQSDLSSPYSPTEPRGNSRAKRRTAKAVNYKEPNSPLHSSSSIRPHRVEKTKNTNNAKATKTKTRPSKQPTPNISPAKHSVLANMLSKSLPTSKLGDEAKKISSNRQALTQPNDAKGSIAENDSNDMALIEVTDADSPQAELPTEAPPETTANPHLKRRAGSSPPSTPRTKRLRADNITGIETRDQPRLMMPPVSNAPLRILEDPSSPCKQQNPPSALKTTPHDGMDVSHDESQTSSRQIVTTSNTQPERRRTPLHQTVPRIHSSGSASIELLSSNSKPMPASPHAESTAISGHADTDLVDMEKQIAEYETAKSDPFKRRVKDHKLTAFARRLTGETVSDKELEIVEVSAQDETIIAKAVETPSHILPLPKTSLAPVKAFQAEMGKPCQSGEDNQISRASAGTPKKTVELKLQEKRAVEKGWSGPSAPQQTPRDAQHEAPEHDGDVDMEGDTTLVELEGEDPTLQASPLHIPSSPPPGSPGPPDPPSSHSSTSASPESDKEPTTPPSDAEEMEWENSLNPDQRSIHDQLIRVSKRVVRHIVDNETAVNDIVDTYAKDGEHLVKTFVDRHSTAFDDQFAEISGKKQALGKEFAVLADSMAREREEWAGEISMTRRVEQARASNKGKAAVRG